jgi:hypothetical protein
MRKRTPTRRKTLNDLEKEGELILRDRIRRLLALPMHKRTHFLRKRLPSGGSAL